MAALRQQGPIQTDSTSHQSAGQDSIAAPDAEHPSEIAQLRTEYENRLAAAADKGEQVIP